MLKFFDKSLEKTENYSIHRFVYESIKRVIPEGFEIDHVKKIKTNNRLRNLQLFNSSKKAEN